MNNFKNNTKQGMTVFLAVVLVSVILASSLTLIGISVKGFQISADSRDSTYAIYAADAGIECALLWDIRGVELTGGLVFPTSTDFIANGFLPAGPLNCFGTNIVAVWDTTDNAATAATTTFQLEFNAPGTYCAIVSVAKSPHPTVAGISNTNILSRGYDAPCPPPAFSANDVERAIRVSYP